MIDFDVCTNIHNHKSRFIMILCCSENVLVDSLCSAGTCQLSCLRVGPIKCFVQRGGWEVPLSVAYWGYVLLWSFFGDHHQHHCNQFRIVIFIVFRPEIEKKKTSHVVWDCVFGAGQVSRFHKAQWE